jgi:hypothetical protein
MHVRGISFTLEKEGNSDTAATWTNLQDIMLREIKQTQKDKCCLTSTNGTQSGKFIQAEGIMVVL